ncbi:MAG: DUF2271 domain-containing protein [Planctomycetota bacterium]
MRTPSKPLIRRGALLGAALTGAAAVTAALTSAGHAREAERHVFDREHVLGTSLHLEVGADSPEAAGALERVVVDEIARLEHILSSYDSASEWRALAAARAPRAASDELTDVLQLCDAWRARSGGVFQPGIGELTQLWRAAAERGVAPTSEALAAAAGRAQEAPWRLDADAHTVEVLAAEAPSLDALAKGYIIDRVCDALRSAGCSDAVVELGGDLRVLGDDARTVAVLDPWRAADNAPPYATLTLGAESPGRAIATSGGYARGFDVGVVHHSHILDPRTGAPADHIAQATVIAPDAATADALATVLCVLKPEEGLALAAAVSGVECLILEVEGQRRHASAGWMDLQAPEGPPAADVSASAWATGQVVLRFELADFSQPAPQEGRRRKGGYRRPYVAAWIEDAEGRDVRTLALWVQKPKWIPDLRRWIKHYRGRVDDVAAVTRATRGPGAYTLEWHGDGDDGAQLAPGAYTVCLEVVREHGGTSMLRRDVVIDGKPFALDFDAGGEVAAASVEFVLLAQDSIGGGSNGGQRE